MEYGLHVLLMNTVLFSLPDYLKITHLGSLEPKAKAALSAPLARPPLQYITVYIAVICYRRRLKEMGESKVICNFFVHCRDDHASEAIHVWPG